MSYTYAQKKRTPGETGAQSATQSGGGVMESSVPNSARLAMLESGQITPTAADKGHRVDLPEAVRAKMESSYNMDFSGVRLYESQMVAESGAEAMAQGNEIAFAPGKLDLASESGQAKLGHEFSHIASQARGEVRGNGFLLDPGLEARADREGAMAARGETVYGGAAAPLSSASPAPMAGPMQAWKNNRSPQKNPNAQQNQEDLNTILSPGASEFQKNKFTSQLKLDFQKKYEGDTEHISDGDAESTLYNAYEESLNTNVEDFLTDEQKYWHENQDSYEDASDYARDRKNSGIQPLSYQELQDYNQKIGRRKTLKSMVDSMKSMKSEIIRQDVLKEEIAKKKAKEKEEIAKAKKIKARPADPATLNKDFKLPEMSKEEEDQYVADWNKREELKKKEDRKRMKENRIKRGEEFDAQKAAMLAKMDELELDEE